MTTVRPGGPRFRCADTELGVRPGRRARTSRAFWPTDHVAAACRTAAVPSVRDLCVVYKQMMFVAFFVAIVSKIILNVNRGALYARTEKELKLK